MFEVNKLSDSELIEKAHATDVVNILEFDIKDIPSEGLVEKPYLEETVIELKYNPNYGDDRICVCGHSYYRHFDSYENMDAIGCKYCYDCRNFVEKI